MHQTVENSHSYAALLSPRRVIFCAGSNKREVAAHVLRKLLHVLTRFSALQRGRAGLEPPG